MPIYKSPKSGKLIEVESNFDLQSGSDKSRDEAISKGWRPVHELVSKSGKTINVDDDGLKEALNKGWQTKDVAAAKRAPVGIGKGEAFARGIAQGTTFGFADELQAGLKAPFSDKTYSELRDADRKLNAASEDEQTGAFYTGAIGSGLASGGAGVAKGVAGAASLGKTIAQGSRVAAIGGAAGGFGSGEGDAASQIESIGTGAIFGGIAGGVGAGIGGKLAGRKFAQKTSDAAERGSGLFDVAKAGAREEMKGVDLYGSGLVDVPRKAIAGIKGAVRGVKDVRSFGKDVQSLGSGKFLGGADDVAGDVADAFDPGADLFRPGASKTKDFVATQAGQTSGVDPATYKRLLELGVDDVIEAKNFDPKAVSKGMVDDLDGLQTAFENSRSAAYKQGQGVARQGFTAEGIDDLNGSLASKVASANADELMPSRTKKVLRVLGKDLAPVLEEVGGTAVDGNGRILKQTRVNGPEMFDRLTKARKVLDSEIDWAKENRFGSGERMLRELRGEIDGMLKTAPGKADTDKLFQNSIDVEKGFFGATEFRGPDGRMGVDEFKLKRLLGDTDAAGRFENQIKNAREYFQNPALPEEMRTAQAAMLDRIDAARKRYGDKRTLDALRQAEGPSSPSINAKAYLLNSAGLPAESIGAPANNLRGMANFVEEYVYKSTGKKFAELSPSEQGRFVKFYSWQKANPKATPEQMQKAANTILGAKP